MMLGQHPAELRADFQRYYGLNLDGMGSDYSVAHAADLAACLPRDSATMRAHDPLNEWTIEAQLLALIEFWAHDWIWAHTKDGKAGRNPPKLRVPTEKKIGGDQERMTVNEMMDFMASLKGVDDG